MSDIRVEEILVDGRWRSASDGSVFTVENPATGRTVASVPRATPDDLEESLRAAQGSGWQRTPAWERSALLREAGRLIRERTDEIARLLTEEQGKPLTESRAEVHTAADQFDWYAQEATRIFGRTVDATSEHLRIEVRREPVGPVAAFTPWNFPVMLAARKLAPALAAGCPVILKPAEEAPSACLAMVHALCDAGLPQGSIAAITGDPVQISETLLGSPIVRKVSLTGSVRVGRVLMGLATTHLARISLELGGHGPVVVCDDVDIAAVAENCATAKFRNAGQICVSPTRFLVPRHAAKEFAAVMARAAESLVIGDGASPQTQLGPLASRRRHDEFAALIDDAVSAGATAITGGRSLALDLGGHFYAPTVLCDVPPTARALQEEPFGPVAIVIPYDDLEEAVDVANSTAYGLAAYIFTRDSDRAQLLSERIAAGMIGINTFLVSTVVAPFSGVGLSGSGVENGPEGIEQYLHPKSVVRQIAHALR